MNKHKKQEIEITARVGKKTNPEIRNILQLYSQNIVRSENVGCKTQAILVCDKK